MAPDDERRSPSVSLSIAVLASGRGSNLEALLEGVHRRTDVPAEVVGVLSDRPEARALAVARAANVGAACIDRRRFDDRAAFEAVLAATLEGLGADLLVLAGFMRVLGADFLRRFAPAVINVHPSLLPDFPGLDPHARVLARGDAESGASVHQVTPEVDGGPVLAQVVVPVHPGDDPETLAARVLAAEHRLYPEVVRWIAAGRLVLSDDGPRLDGRALPPRGRRFRVADDALEPLCAS